MRFVAVTACPTGIAHTYMAAEALEQAAKAAGDEIHVETQGSAGADRMADETIAQADAVVFAADVGVVDRERFDGKPLVQVTVKQAINDAPGVLQAAKDRTAEQPEDSPRSASSGATAQSGSNRPELATKVAANAGFGTQLRQWLMTGVSYVIPFVAAGGLMIALSFALGGYQVANAPKVTQVFDIASVQSWAALLFQVGSLGMAFLVPVLAGFVAFAMADRPAIAPGFIGGAAALAVGAGFLGGLAAGLLAGAVVGAMRKVAVPKAVAGIMPVVVLPLLGSLVTGVLVFVVIGKPIAIATQALTAWLGGLSGGNALLLGALLGAMMAFDMGGPINKVAYTFAVAGLSTGAEGALHIMAATMAAGMVPPLALALAAAVRRHLFTAAERENARAAWLLGASFITEGAIPFAAADPLRVIPPLMVGSAATGAAAMGLGATLRAPHGGIFVLPLIGNPLGFMVALVVGVIISAIGVVGLKQLRERATETSTPAVRNEPVQV